MSHDSLIDLFDMYVANVKDMPSHPELLMNWRFP